jgi:hypothetical protein
VGPETGFLTETRFLLLAIAGVEEFQLQGKIPRADQQRFMSAMLSRETLSGEDQKKINRVFDALQKGLLRVVD